MQCLFERVRKQSLFFFEGEGGMKGKRVEYGSKVTRKMTSVACFYDTSILCAQKDRTNSQLAISQEWNLVGFFKIGKTQTVLLRNNLQLGL